MGMGGDDGDGDEEKRTKEKDGRRGGGSVLEGMAEWPSSNSAAGCDSRRLALLGAAARVTTSNNACQLLHLRPKWHTYILRRIEIQFNDRRRHLFSLHFCVFASISSCAALGIRASRKLCRSESPL